MTARDKVTKLLNDVGAVLKRQRNHEVWQLPNGKNFVRAKTPSDSHGDDNNLSDLKRELGIVTVKEPAAPSATKMRRRKLGKTVQHERLKSNVASLNLAESLRMAGLTDDALRERLTQAETRMEEIQQQLTALQMQVDNCWAIRFALWLRRFQRGKSSAGEKV